MVRPSFSVLARCWYSITLIATLVLALLLLQPILSDPAVMSNSGTGDWTKLRREMREEYETLSITTREQLLVTDSTVKLPDSSPCPPPAGLTGSKPGQTQRSRQLLTYFYIEF